MRRLVLPPLAALALAATFAGPAPAAEPVSAADAEFFEKRVRPLLVEKCGKCHGEGPKVKGGLRLTTRAELLAGGDSGPAIVPGKPDESLLIKAVRYQLDDNRMPPESKLPAADIAVLADWVGRGAPWPEAGPSKVVAGKFRITEEQRRFWAFRPVAAVTLPAVKDAAWPADPLDRFILAGLEAKGLRPARPADKRTLIRRATFDLTGLPPTPEVVEAFVKDESPEAFATVVDRLLASPAYGERWGRHWLDVVRYADFRDSRGLGGDHDIGEAWRYRDWVINALNRDLPYDRFVRDQVAGDLAPPAEKGGVNVDGLIATGLLTIGEWGTGDADKEKMVTDIVNDQVDVVCRSFLGLTVACARCHDHKFDPISQADYFGLAGIFFSTKILPGPGAKTGGSPMLRTPLVPAAEVARRAGLPQRAKDLDAEAARLHDAAAADVARSMLPETGKYLLAAHEYRRKPAGPLAEFAAARGLKPWALQKWSEATGVGVAYRRLGTLTRDTSGMKGVHSWRGQADTPLAFLNTTGETARITTLALPPRSVSVHPGPKSPVAVSWTAPADATVKVVGKVIDSDGTCGDGVAWALDLSTRGGRRELARGEIANGGKADLPTKGLEALALKAGDRLELVVLPKGEYTCDTTTLALALSAGDKTWDLAGDLLAPAGPTNPTGPWELHDCGEGRPTPGPADEALAAWTKAVAEGADADGLAKAAAAVTASYTRTEAGSPFHPAPGQADDLLAPADRERIAAVRKEAADVRAELAKPLPSALAAQEGGVPGGMYPGIQDVHVHIRGSYARLGEKVPRHFPTILAGEEQAPIRDGSGRTELAAWLADAKNPLTARVMVNRAWAWHFGEGIVRTPSNFGFLGERPTHPELLDHLAGEFVRDGWSLKKLHRRIMLSATYRQAAVTDPAAVKADPDNRHFGRANPRRLEAEALRDALLAASGQLDRTAGGPSYPDLNTPRRTVYLRAVRSDKAGFGPLFDAADPETPTDKRTVSTVAPQALWLLNHPFAVARAKALAARLAKEAGDDAARVDRAYRLLYARPPRPDEAKAGLAFVTGGGPAAWEEYAGVLLCANEFVYVD